MMALESVFSTPPPVVGARYKDETMKHGEKESNDESASKNNGDVQHLEEGELEEGEIIEEGGDDDGLRGYGTDNGPDDQCIVKKKKKKRKKRKREYDPANAEGSAETLPGKKKRPRYVDHDSVAKAEEEWDVQGPRAMGNMRRNYPFETRDSPPMFPRGRSPQDLYDSPYNSNGEEQQDDGPASGDVERLVKDAREVLHEKGRRAGDRRSGKEMRRLKNLKKKEMRRRPICKFFLDGKCAKGADCSFLHDGAPPKKTDLCKFYLNGFCAKGEGCLYMHEDFPCKFFHTGAKCYAGDSCKFSHSPLNEDTKRILANCLDSPIRDEEFPAHGGGPGGGQPSGKGHRPSLLGSPPAHIKEMVVHDARKKVIPSLFDIQVKPPVMPAGHQQQMRPNFYRDQGPGGGGSPARPPLLPMPTAFPSPRFGFDHMSPQNHAGNPDNDSGLSSGPGGNGNARHHHQGMAQNNPVDPDAARCATPINNRDVSDDDGWESDRCDRGGFVRVETTNGSPMWVQKDDDDVEDDDDDEPNHVYDNERVRSDEEEDNSLTIDERCHQEQKDVKEVEGERDAVADKWDSSSNSGTDDECQRPQPEIAIPTHLPKKQRELFLRIQQQQREANSIQVEEDKKKEEGEKEEDKKEEEGDEVEEEAKKAGDTWYSSDEEDDDNDVPLAAVLKKLQQEPVDKPSQQVPKMNLGGGSSATFDIAKMLQAIRNKGQQETVSAPALPAKDPRAAKPERQDPRTLRGSRDPRLGRVPAVPVPTAPVSQQVVAPPETIKSSEPKSTATPKSITAFHPMAYKLQAIAATHANYSTLQGLCKDPKFQNDPRLRARSRPAAIVSNGNSAAKGMRQTGTVKMPASRTSSRSSSATKDSGESDCEMTKRPSEPISSPPLHGSFGNSADTAPTSLITLVPLPVPIPPPLPPLLISLGSSPVITVPEPVKNVAEKTTQKHKLVAKKALRIGKIVPGAKKNFERGVGELPRSVLELRKGLNYESPLAFSDRTETPTLSYNRKPLPDLTIAASPPVVDVPETKLVIEASGSLDGPKDMETALGGTEEDMGDSDTERNKSLKDMFQTKDPTASPFC